MTPETIFFSFVVIGWIVLFTVDQRRTEYLEDIKELREEYSKIIPHYELSYLQFHKLDSRTYTPDFKNIKAVASFLSLLDYLDHESYVSAISGDDDGSVSKLKNRVPRAEDELKRTLGVYKLPQEVNYKHNDKWGVTIHIPAKYTEGL